jgi:hypothetical protein
MDEAGAPQAEVDLIMPAISRFDKSVRPFRRRGRPFLSRWRFS